jgi:ANTAR domain
MSVDRATGRDDRRGDVVVRKADHGWVVGGENVSDLTSAIVLADLFAADAAANDDPRLLEAVERSGGARPNGSPPAAPQQRAVRRDTPGRHARPVAPGAPGTPGTTGTTDMTEVDEAARLAVTVAQLEHALASRVRVEQAIGVLAERHRLRPREAFDLLRGAARSRGQRVTEIAQDVVASTANPLLRLPDELARKLPEQRPRGRSLRRGPKPAEQF